MSNNTLLQLTEPAVNHVQAMIRQQGHGKGLRISVKITGCSGYQYDTHIVDEGQPEDQLVTTSQGLPVFIDPTCVDMLRGTVVDWVQQGLGQRLVFHNPNVSGECGCGESFQLKQADAHE
ncbi:MAG: hypothetical protein A3F41_04380 [Coxiella sp. RIFCSPHIGHO2_12_FULL_44_14]|nr:MAG: hypothetical protein A3F41_04380 [Coxiella sp. RIFCSPHIGHO2_12_FULL_44_14]